MNIDLSSCVFTWLLPLVSCVALTTGQGYNLSTVTTGQGYNLSAVTTGQGYNLSAVTTGQGYNLSAVTTGQGYNLPTSPGPGSLRPDLTLTRSSPTSTPDLRAATPATVPTTSAEISTPGQREGVSTATAATSVEARSAPRTDTTAAGVSVPTSHPAGTTALVSTVAPPTPSTSISSLPTTPTTTKKPTNHITRAAKEEGTKSIKVGGNGAVVAWVIGGTLALMMLSFLFIYIRKRKLNEQQITSKNWAGPSPFIENGEDNCQVKPSSSNRISLSSFLPQRASRRLSLLPEAEEELEDIVPGSTFGDRQREAPSPQQVAGGGVREGSGSAKAAVSQTDGSETRHSDEGRSQF